MDRRRGAQCRPQRRSGEPRWPRPSYSDRGSGCGSRSGERRRPDWRSSGGGPCRVIDPSKQTLWRRLTMARRVAVVWVLALAVAASASAQTGSSGTSTGQSTTTTQKPSSSTDTAQETRPATTTFFGDTGLWYVPTAEILANGKWSVSAYRRGTNWIQGYTNVA